MMTPTPGSVFASAVRACFDGNAGLTGAKLVPRRAKPRRDGPGYSAAVSRLLPAVAAAVLAIVALAAATTRAGAAAERTARFPRPPANATVFARQFRNDALALAVVPLGGNALRVQASVVGRQRNGVSGLRVTLAVSGHTKLAVACGAGCYTADFAPAARPRVVEVTLRGSRNGSWSVSLPAAWPPRPAGSLVARAARVWRSLDSLTFREDLASGVGISVTSTWRVERPDRVAYEVKGGGAGVIVGTRRWDRAPGSRRWEQSSQSRLPQPLPAWLSVTDAHVLGDVVYRGRSAVRLSFYDPASHSWFTLTIDRKTFRTLDVWMITNAHFMHDVYRAFNATPPIVPPA
jgi:hypothetical protein